MPKKLQTTVDNKGVIHLRRPWSEAAPRTVGQRRAVMKKCGARCFMDPDNLKYPVCPGNPRPTCKVSKKGADAARRRSAQYHRRKVESKAKALQKRIKKA